MLKEEIRKQLKREAEPDYKEFQAKLLPGVDGILGVRLPKLREIAKRIAKTDAQEYLNHEMYAVIHSADEDSIVYYEEKMLYGMVIGYAKADDAQRRQWLDLFVPRIDSWGVCDSCCMTYKWMKEKPELWWEYVKTWTFANEEYEIRFGLVCMLAHFIDERHIQEILAVCSRVLHEGYYAKMAQAWLVSACFVKFPEQTYLFLEKDNMDPFTHNKAIQKTCESYRVSKEWKDKIRSLKRSI